MKKSLGFMYGAVALVIALGALALQDAVAARAKVYGELGQTDAERADLTRCVELSGSTEAGKNCRSMLEKLK